MDQVTGTKVRFRRNQWKQLIFECQSSGMTVSSWCKQNGYKEQTYYYYLKKIREDELKNFPQPLALTKEENPVAFKRLEVQTPIPSTTAAVIIRLPGATIEVNEGTSQQTIQAVLLALHSI